MLTPEEVQAQAALEAVEWLGSLWSACPACGQEKQKGPDHRLGCTLKAALDALRAKRAGSSGAAVGRKPVDPDAPLTPKQIEDLRLVFRRLT